MKTVANDAEAYILFELGSTRYAVRSSEVQHMEMVDHITPVPNAPAFVEGVVFSRGQVVPIINLRTRFGLPVQAHNLRSRMLVVKTKDRTVGMIVDSAREFRIIPADSIQPPQAAVQDLGGNFLSGIATLGDRLVLILDLNKTLYFSDLNKLSVAEAELTTG
jgi:chemotaxis signal transduction protein